jgi:hypothetical protein
LDNKGATRKSILGCLTLVLLVFACISTSVVALDALCYQTLSLRMQSYPGATVMRSQHNMFRQYGMGESYVELYSPDPPTEVRRWYGANVGVIERELVRTQDATYRLATVERQVYTATDPAGSQIFLYGRCAS